MSTLRADTISKHFGGVHALRNVTLDVRRGEIHGLIGPNGSGKTTLLNLLLGYYRTNAGRILIDDVDLTRASVQARASHGIARTFQQPRLLGALSVLDNAMLGQWTNTAAGFLEACLALPRVHREERQAREHARELLYGVGLGQIIDRRAHLLEHAEQRFLEIARGLVMQPHFLLLDEPAGGLTEHEIEALGEIVTAVRDCNIGVLIVEHHTDFVFRICDRVTALNLGSVLAHGVPKEVRSDEELIRVYLGA